MREFISSDLHFFHKNIAVYCPKSRGHFIKDEWIDEDHFQTTMVEEMNQEIVSKHNSKVDEEDHTYILGDICFGTPQSAIELLSQMNGTKTIILGNHDRKLMKSSIFHDDSQRRIAGITEVDNYKVISHKLNGKSYGVVLFHFKISGWDGMHHGSIHLHGHEHGTGPIHPGRCKDVGIDTNDLYPYNLHELVEELSSKPMTYEGHHDGARE